MSLAAGTTRKSVLKYSRRGIAWPLYFLAFVLHLLCSGVTVLAAMIAGDPL
jgi:hypothetical protein